MIRERGHGEDLAARVLGHCVRARVEREPLRFVDLPQVGERRRERGLVVGLEPTIAPCGGDA